MREHGQQAVDQSPIPQDLRAFEEFLVLASHLDRVNHFTLPDASSQSPSGFGLLFRRFPDLQHWSVIDANRVVVVTYAKTLLAVSGPTGDLHGEELES
ncbi:MAG: hypothetical protein DWH91_15255 [Planctomycetota bacterium]|nr:MAG: hypothetical protein DWH91_15255 [Planctomycetota bacterium]